MKVFNRHVVVIFAFQLYTHMDKVTYLGGNLICKVLFSSFSIMTVLEFVCGVDHRWVIQLELVNIDILGEVCTTVR